MLNKRIQHSKDKPPCPNPVLPLNVSEGDQTNCEDYNDDQNGTRTDNLSIKTRIITKIDNNHEDKIADGDEPDYELEYIRKKKLLQESE